MERIHHDLYRNDVAIIRSPAESDSRLYTMTSEHYQYESLRSEASFRLLRLKPKQPPDASALIEVELFETYDASFPPFDSISYAWGQAEAVSVVVCNGRPLLVTPTVVSILQALQDLGSSRPLWIDSICINQSSTLGKNMQVPKMSSIYHNATKVWIWLGGVTPEVDIAFDLLVELTAIFDRDPSFGEALNSFHRFIAKVATSRGFHDAADTSFVLDMINLPWFHRTWTVQELVLAKEPIVLHGLKSLPWYSFLHALEEANKLANVIPQNGYRTSNPASYNNEMLCYRQLWVIMHDRRSSKQPSIVLPLKYVRSKLSADPKDKVYGLYGAFHHLPVSCLPKVDYGKDVADIYTEIAWATIQSEHSLHLLHENCLPSSIPSLPSWVPDWSNNGYILPLIYRAFSAAGLSESIYSFQGYRLVVSGFLVDEISELADSTSICTPDFRRGYRARANLETQQERLPAIKELIRTLQSWVGCGRLLQTYPTGEPALYALYSIIAPGCGYLESEPARVMNVSSVSFEKWLSVLGTGFNESLRIDRLHNEIRHKPEYAARRDNYMDLCECSRDVDDWPAELKLRLIILLYSEDVARVQHWAGLHTYQRTFFTTRDGYMGIGPRWVQSNDELALVSGVQVPLSMRKSCRNYRIIGPAYVHGIMAGERWNESRLQDMTFV